LVIHGAAKPIARIGQDSARQAFFELLICLLLSLHGQTPVRRE
jgi:hypothetical protein